jgi:hypothetical protein
VAAARGHRADEELPQFIREQRQVGLRQGSQVSRRAHAIQ